MTDQFTTAMQLLLGDRPTLDDVQQAAGLLEAASAEGHAEASERRSLLAARQGSRLAQEQLLLLRDNQSDPVVPADADPEAWAKVRASIPLEQRMQPGETQSLSDSPRIRLIRRFATPAECRWLIELGRPQLGPATVFDQSTGTQMLDPSRDNSFFVLRLGEMNVLLEQRFRHPVLAGRRGSVGLLFQLLGFRHFPPSWRRTMELQSAEARPTVRSAPRQAIANPLRKDPLLARSRWQTGVERARIGGPVASHIREEQGIARFGAIVEADSWKAGLATRIAGVEIDQEGRDPLPERSQRLGIGGVGRIEEIMVQLEPLADRVMEQ